MKINFMSRKDNNEKCVMHSKGNNIDTMIGNDTDEIIEELFSGFFFWISILTL